MNDPIFFHEFDEPITEWPGDVEPRGWYFWMEDEAHYMGPFPTKTICQQNLTDYAETL